LADNFIGNLLMTPTAWHPANNSIGNLLKTFTSGLHSTRSPMTGEPLMGEDESPPDQLEQPSNPYTMPPLQLTPLATRESGIIISRSIRHLLILDQKVVYHFVRDPQSKSVMSLHKNDTKDNHADPFRKALDNTECHALNNTEFHAFFINHLHN
jgi:hypothetical protein